MKVLLVATDGGRLAVNALGFAAAYSSAHGVPVELVAFVAPLSDLRVPLPHRVELEEAHARGVAEGIRGRIRDTIGPVDWPIHVRLGRPAPVVATVARARDARMILLAVDSRRDEEGAVAVELLHLADQPVLVVHDGTLPRTAVVGVDFSTASLRAAEATAALIGPAGVIHLVHVNPPLDFPAASVWGWEPCYAGALTGAFDQLARKLEAVGAGTVERHERAGDPVEELPSAVAELDGDLLAIGSDGYMCDGRAVVGRVARKLLAGPKAAVLAMPVMTTITGPFAPPRTTTHGAARNPAATKQPRQASWSV